MADVNVKMRILIVAYWHDPRYKKKTGGLIRMFELADNLQALGHSVTMVLPKLGNPQQQTSARVIQIPFLDFSVLRPLSFHVFSTVRLMFALREQPDFMYVRQMNSFLPLAAARLLRVPVIFEFPNDPFLGYKESGRIKGFLERTMDKAAIKLADKIVVLSEWSKARLVRFGQVPDSRIIVLPSGTDTDLFKPGDRMEACRKLGLDPGNLHVGFIGSFLKYQGIDTLIAAAPSILREFPAARFLLVGSGPMLRAWKEEIQARHLEYAFIFTGQVPYREVPSYLQAMDICVAPHHAASNQASPVKLFDYMACGKPIVASDIEVVREITDTSGCAKLVAPESPAELACEILGLLRNKEERNRLGKQGRAFVSSNFDRSLITERLLSEFLKDS